MYRFAILTVTLLVLAFASSCSDEDRWTPDLSELSHTRVHVANFSAEPINEVYLRSAGRTDWGPISA